MKFFIIRFSSYRKTENKRALPPHGVVKQGVKALAYGYSIGFTPCLKAREGARLHESDNPHLGQAIGLRRHLRSPTARQRMSAPMLKRQSAALRMSLVIGVF